MLSKCANPACSAKLLYLGDGKIFRVEREMASRNAAQRKVAATEHAFEIVAGRGVEGRREYFWLCSGCSQQMTLAFRDRSVVILPLVVKANAARAAAS